jgi:hypothetical protein
MQLLKVLLFFLSAAHGISTDRPIRLFNDAGVKVEVYWINPTTRAASLMSTPSIYDGAQMPLNSFVGHEFELREVPAADTGACANEDKVCHSVNFLVSENDNQGELVLFWKKRQGCML